MTMLNLDRQSLDLSSALRCAARYAAVLGAVVILSTTQSMARQIDRSPGNNNPTKDELEDDGYDCDYVATNFWECTKTGEKTYWCDSTGQCVPKPFKTGPQNPTYRFHQQINPGTMSVR